MARRRKMHHKAKSISRKRKKHTKKPRGFALWWKRISNI